MLYNSRKYSIAEYSMSRIDDEVAIYAEKRKAILMLNKTATFIWDRLIPMESNDDIDIISYLNNAIEEAFDLRDNEHVIRNDIIEVVEMLIENNLLIEVEKMPDNSTT